MNFAPLHVHSHFSLLDGLSQPNQIADRCANLGYKACALTDHGSISGAVSFMKEMEKKNILPIMGVELYISRKSATNQSPENRELDHQVVLARNLDGWKQLVKMVSRSSDPDLFYYKPRIDLDILGEYTTEDLISFSGHPGSILYNLISKGDVVGTEDYLNLMRDLFHSNFYIEIQLIDTRPEVKQIMNELRYLAEVYKLKTIATCDAHYANPNQAEDHRVLLCSALKTTLREVREKIEDDQKMGLDGFFKTERFHIPSPQELLEYGNNQEEIENTQLIVDKCESYSILGQPMLPKYKWTEGQSEVEYFKQLCREGWVKRKIKDRQNYSTYVDIIRKELDIIIDAGLVGYFLIVQDYVKYAKSQGWLCGPGRGSAGGCLVSYLLEITSIDPVKHGLIFERFYNSARNLPDFMSFVEKPYNNGV